MVALIVPPDKSPEAVRKWLPVVAFTRRVAKAEGINLIEIRLHSHARGSIACYDAQASWEDHFVEFCGGQNRETALHELAHLVVEDYHSRVWATALMALHRTYLPPARCQRADRVLAMEYRSARPLYLARYGHAAPHKSELPPARKCHQRRRKK